MTSMLGAAFRKLWFEPARNIREGLIQALPRKELYAAGKRRLRPSHRHSLP